MKSRGRAGKECGGFVLFFSLLFLLPLNTGQYGSDIVCRTPPILQYIQAQLARVVYVWMKHLTDELDSRRLIRVLLLKMHDQSKCAIFKRRVRRPDDDGVPISHTQTRSIRKPSILSGSEESGTKISLPLVPAGEVVGGGFGGCGGEGGKRVIYHVITLSAIGEADTPAGGSVCIRCFYQSHGMIN